MLGLLYDIHGNLIALEAVLYEAGREGIDRWLLGGDYGVASPWPRETLARLRELPNATWIRGNGERELVRELGVSIYTMTDLDRRGVEPVIREALERVAGAAFVHMSLDVDVVDPDVAPGVGTPVRGGLSYREAHLAMELVAESGLLDSLDVVEVNPILDRENATAELAVELVASALGERIL